MTGGCWEPEMWSPFVHPKHPECSRSNGCHHYGLPRAPPNVDRVTKRWPTGGSKAIRQHPNVDTNATAKRPFVSALDGFSGFSDLVQIYHGHFGRFLSDLKKMNTSFQQVDRLSRINFIRPLRFDQPIPGENTKTNSRFNPSKIEDLTNGPLSCQSYYILRLSQVEGSIQLVLLGISWIQGIDLI